MSDQSGARTQQASAIAAAGRLFRSYERHCSQPGPDTLFEVLTAMHSLNDRLRLAVNRDLHALAEFVALKALRNFAHHREEVQANVRVIPAPAISDLASMCLVRTDQVERAVEASEKRWAAETRAACETKFHWYGQAVNINPCLCNFMVRTYELLMELGVDPPAADVATFEASYRFEAAGGHPHLVDGRLTSRAADVRTVLSAAVAGLPSPP